MEINYVKHEFRFNECYLNVVWLFALFTISIHLFHCMGHKGMPIRPCKTIHLIHCISEHGSIDAFDLYVYDCIRLSDMGK